MRFKECQCSQCCHVLQPHTCIQHKYIPVKMHILNAGEYTQRKHVYMTKIQIPIKYTWTLLMCTYSKFTCIHDIQYIHSFTYTQRYILINKQGTHTHNGTCTQERYIAKYKTIKQRRPTPPLSPSMEWKSPYGELMRHLQRENAIYGVKSSLMRHLQRVAYFFVPLPYTMTPNAVSVLYKE